MTVAARPRMLVMRVNCMLADFGLLEGLIVL